MTIEVPSGGFRCPFELKGDAEGTIMEVPLEADRTKRFEQIHQGLKGFQDTPASPGIKFSLPFAGLERCSSIRRAERSSSPVSMRIFSH